MNGDPVPRMDDSAILLKKGSITKPDVYKVPVPGSNSKWILLKTFRDKPFLIRTIYGRWLLGREASLLKRLSEIEGVPKLISVSSINLEEEFIPGSSFSECLLQNREVPLSKFKKLKDIVDLIHSRQVFHLDLRLSSNYILDFEGNPHIIDFNSAIFLPKVPFLFKNIANFLKSIDISGILKMKSEFHPQSLDESEVAFLRKINRMRKFWVFTRRGQKTRDFSAGE